MLEGIESLTIFADADKPGLDAAETCCERWREAGREARVVARGGPSSKHPKDWAEAHVTGDVAISEAADQVLDRRA